MDVIGRVGVMIVDMDFNSLFFSYLRKRTDPAFLPGIHQDKPLDVVEGNLFQFGKIEKIRCGVNEEIPEIFFMGPRENKGRFRVQLACCKHGGKGIKIGVDMGCYHFPVYFVLQTLFSGSPVLGSFHVAFKIMSWLFGGISLRGSWLRALGCTREVGFSERILFPKKKAGHPIEPACEGVFP